MFNLNYTPLSDIYAVSMSRALPGDTTPVSVPMTRDGGAVVAPQRGNLTGVGVGATINLEWDDTAWDASVVGAAIQMLTGLNAGLWRVVRTRTDDDDIVTDPFPYACAAGDEFVVEKPQMRVHEAYIKLDTDTTGFDVYVAPGDGLVADAAYADARLLEPADVMLLSRRGGFNAISIYAGGDLSAYKYTLWGL